MDILRKELNDIYSAQRLGLELLPSAGLTEVREMAAAVVKATDACAVITDASCDRCYIYSGRFGELMGFSDRTPSCVTADSSDEDVIYKRIHPEDLVDKRMLEYEYFKRVGAMDPEGRMHTRATCCLRMKDRAGAYRYIDNSTRVARLSPRGKIWLILCLYDLAPEQHGDEGITPRIVGSATGEITSLSFEAGRRHILTEREKQIMRLIQQGRASKQIAAALGISVNTVNRHRQNIISKLSVGNSVEAITAAKAMRLL